MTLDRVVFALRLLGALPCSTVGIALGLLAVGIGGSVRRVEHTLEVAVKLRHEHVPRWASRRRFARITFGPVILGQSHAVLAVLRHHERVHVKRYGRPGVSSSSPTLLQAWPLCLAASALVAAVAPNKRHMPPGSEARMRPTCRSIEATTASHPGRASALVNHRPRGQGAMPPRPRWL